MDWSTFWILLAQVAIASASFVIISIPISWGIRIIRQAFQRASQDRGIFHGPDRG